MPTFQVQLWPNGSWDEKDYIKVEAPTAKEAAEKLLGQPLQERGANCDIRAQVRPLDNFRAPSKFFFKS